MNARREPTQVESVSLDDLPGGQHRLTATLAGGSTLVLYGKASGELRFAEESGSTLIVNFGTEDQ